MNIAEIWLDFSSSKGYSLYATSHHQLSWYFLKCFFAHASSSFKPPERFTFKIYFWSKGFLWSLVEFCSTVSAHLKKVLPGLCVCLCYPLSFSFIPECRFEVVFMQIEQFDPHFVSTSLWPIFSNFQLACLILYLLALQNVSGKIVAQLCKMCPHDSPVSFTLFFWVLLY